jgi:CRP-like cAMP-binding protein
VPIDIGGEAVVLETRWNLHPIPTNGFKLHCAGRTFGYSADTQYDPELLNRLHAQGKLSDRHYDDLMYFLWTADGQPKADLVYHEAGIPPIHTDKAQLQRLPESVKERLYLVHIADRDVPEGFTPRKPPLFATQVLVPPTAGSRDRILLETMRLVCYLYDTPEGTLEDLLRDAELQRYSADEVIIQKGRVAKQETLRFYVIVDGEVAVKDGRRLITKLGKADSFGEWGISHLSGYRVADVVAVCPCQCLQFTEAQYRQLITHHPVIQDRIDKIRNFLPRLQFAQARARLKAAVDPSLQRSVIADMTIGQLSGVAMFSEVRVFRERHAVITEGEEADGFYILLNGHLLATVGDRVVGELSEGDVFGEIGLLEGGKRSATVTVVSVDAEILCMNTRSFQDLLHAGPAFAWGIRETAAQRQAISRGTA